jgi:hypothetical protein
MYFLKKEGIDQQGVIDTVNKILLHVGIAVSDEQIFSLAMQSSFTDLEDAVQNYTALHIKGIDYFITSNLKDYKNASSQLSMLSPKQFMVLYNKKRST